MAHVSNPCFGALPREVEPWMAALGAAEIPVLSRSVMALARLREFEDRITGHDIARVLLHDPLFSLRLLRFVQNLRDDARTADITTVEHALMMLGVTPFFDRFAGLPTVEATIGARPLALSGLMRVMSRSHHAALYARDWAEARRDAAANEVAIAALLHEVAEMLLWCFAPDSALAIERMQRSAPGFRSSAAQEAVLGFRLAELQRVLVEEWKLGALLRSLMSDARATQARAMNVLLAVNLARHSANGWDNPALPADYAAIAQLLNFTREQVMETISRTAEQAEQARDWYLPQS